MLLCITEQFQMVAENAVAAERKPGLIAAAADASDEAAILGSSSSSSSSSHRPTR